MRMKTLTWFLGLLGLILVAALVGMDIHYKQEISTLEGGLVDLIGVSDKKEGMLDDIISEYELLKAENVKLKKKIKKLLTVENKSELHIINYILKYYKKVPPVLAREIAKVSLEKAAEYNVSFHVIVAVMEVESNFDPYSVSK